MRTLLRASFLGCSLTLFTTSFAFSTDLALADGPAPFAPLEITKNGAQALTLTKAERRDLVQQFEGLLYMAKQNPGYQAWPGRSMSDCLSAKDLGQTGPWSFRCEMITPHTKAYYYFFGPMREENAKMREVDIDFTVSDPEALFDLKAPVQQLLGKGRPMNAEATGWQWLSNGQEAILYADASQRDPNGLPPLRFHWTIR